MEGKCRYCVIFINGEVDYCTNPFYHMFIAEAK